MQGETTHDQVERAVGDRQVFFVGDQAQSLGARHHRLGAIGRQQGFDIGALCQAFGECPGMAAEIEGARKAPRRIGQPLHQIVGDVFDQEVEIREITGRAVAVPPD